MHQEGYLFYKNLDDILTNFFDLSNTNIADLITKGSDYDYNYNYHCACKCLYKLVTNIFPSPN